MKKNTKLQQPFELLTQKFLSKIKYGELTVKFPSLLIKPLVPSSGSTNQYGPLGFWFSEWKVSSEIKMLKPVEPYKGKGIKERGQYVIRKEGKKK